MIHVTWKSANDDDISAEVEDGMSLMEAAIANHVPSIEGECGGCLSCATCHVLVDEPWLPAVGVMDDLEDTMLEMTDVERQHNSRLSCQIIASAKLDGLILHLPEPE